jgi:hypothetical protein
MVYVMGPQRDMRESELVVEMCACTIIDEFRPFMEPMFLGYSRMHGLDLVSIEESARQSSQLTAGRRAEHSFLTPWVFRRECLINQVI